MNISANQFTKKSFRTGSGTPTDGIVPVSTNVATRRQIQKGGNGWVGPNINSSGYGPEDLFGGPFSTFGVGEFGGISHFANRTSYRFTH